MKILDRYIGKAIILGTGIVLLTLVGIEMVMEFSSELGDIGKQNYGICQAILYVLRQLPTDVYQLFPVAGFLGTLIGLGRLASQSELIIMRCSGVSIARITWAVVKAALLMLVILTLVGEGQGPRWLFQAAMAKQVAINHDYSPLRKALWLRHNETYVNIDHMLSIEHIVGVTLFDFDKQGHLLTTGYAKEAIYDRHQKQWYLYEENETVFKDSQVETFHYSKRPLSFALQPKFLKRSYKDTDQDSIIELWRSIHNRRAAGLVVNQFQFSFWQRVMQPFTTLVMICLSIPFVFGSLRSASMGTRVLVGITIGFGFHMLNRFCGSLAIVYQWPAILVAALPTMMFLLLCIILLYRTR